VVFQRAWWSQAWRISTCYFQGELLKPRLRDLVRQRKGVGEGALSTWMRVDCIEEMEEASDAQRMGVEEVVGGLALLYASALVSDI